VLLFFAQQHLREAKQNAQFEQRLRQNAVVRRDEAKSRVVLEKARRELLSRASARDLTPRHWVSRLVDVRQSRLSRDEANELLLSIARNGSRLFHLETLDMSLSGAGESLFGAPVREEAPMTLMLRGTLIFRAKGDAP
jgi:hypothetical protein